MYNSSLQAGVLQLYLQKKDSIIFARNFNLQKPFTKTNKKHDDIYAWKLNQGLFCESTASVYPKNQGAVCLLLDWPPHLTDFPSLFKFSQLISWAHSPHTVLQPVFVPWLLRVNKCARLVHFRCTTRFLNLPLGSMVLLMVSGTGGVGTFGTSCFRPTADSSSGTRGTSSHCRVLRYTSHAMSCSSFDSFSSSFSCKRDSCSW